MSMFVYKGGRGGQKSQKNGYVVCVRPLACALSSLYIGIFHPGGDKLDFSIDEIYSTCQYNTHLV